MRRDSLSGKEMGRSRAEITAFSGDHSPQVCTNTCFLPISPINETFSTACASPAASAGMLLVAYLWAAADCGAFPGQLPLSACNEESQTLLLEGPSSPTQQHIICVEIKTGDSCLNSRAELSRKEEKHRTCP